jgi:hypothetical protein
MLKQRQYGRGCELYFYTFSLLLLLLLLLLYFIAHDVSTNTQAQLWV